MNMVKADIPPNRRRSVVSDAAAAPAGVVGYGAIVASVNDCFASRLAYSVLFRKLGRNLSCANTLKVKELTAMWRLELARMIVDECAPRGLATIT